MPILWVFWRLEFISAEHAPILSGRSYRQNEREAIGRALEIPNLDPMDAAVEVHRRSSHVRRMQTIVVDDKLTVDEQCRAVIREKRKTIDSGLLNPKAASVVDREPLIAMCDAQGSRRASGSAATPWGTRTLI